MELYSREKLMRLFQFGKMIDYGKTNESIQINKRLTTNLKLSYDVWKYLFNIIKEMKLKYPKVIFDPFAGIGLDIIAISQFLPNGSTIIGTEIHDETYEALLNNVSKVQLANNGTTFIMKNMDCQELLIDNIKVDLLYLDPPWGETYVTDKEFDFATEPFQSKIHNEVNKQDINIIKITIMQFLYNLIEKISPEIIIVKLPRKSKPFSIDGYRYLHVKETFKLNFVIFIRRKILI